MRLYAVAPSGAGLGGEDEEAAARDLRGLEHRRGGADVDDRLIDRGARHQRHHEERRAAIHFLRQHAGTKAPTDRCRAPPASAAGAFSVGPNTGFCCVIHANCSDSSVFSAPSVAHSSSTSVGPMPRPNVNSFRPGRDGTIVGKRERRPDDGMSGELHFVGRTEDPQPHVGAGGLGGLDEGAFGELRLARHRLHLLGGQARGLGEHRQLVAGQRLVGEDVVLQIAAAIDDRRPSDLLGRQRERHGGGQRGGHETHPRTPS